MIDLKICNLKKLLSSNQSFCNDVLRGFHDFIKYCIIYSFNIYNTSYYNKLYVISYCYSFYI